MNTSQGALYFGAGIDLNQFNRDIESMRRSILGLSQDAQRESRNMDSAFKNLFAGIAGYFSVSALKSFVMELINVRGEFQKTEIAFSTMLGNVGEAKALMGDMVDLAAKTPFSLQDVSSGAKQLLAFQVPANEVVDTLTRMGNIAAGLSIPLSRINLVYGQVKAKGKLAGDDLRQFTEAGIPMVAELAKKFNKTTAEISAMVSAGKIGFKDVQDVLFSMTNEGGMFFNLMEKQSKSLSGQIANLGDAWDQMLNTIGEGQEGILSDGIQGLVYLVEHYQEVGKALLTLIEIYGAYRTALIVTNLLQSGIAAPAIVQGFANLIKIIRGATVAQEALNAASLKNPYVLVATLIAALIAVTYNYRQEIGELLGIIEKATVAQKIQDQVMKQYNDNFGKGVVDTRSAIQQLIYVIKSEYSSLKQREEAYKKLIAIDATFVGTLDNQFRATNRLSLAFENLIKNLQKYAMAQAEVAVRSEKFKEFAEAEMNVGITQVKLDDAKAKIEELTKLFNAGKISQEQYFKGLEKTQGTELNKLLIEQKEGLKAITKEKEYIQKLDQKEISNLLKGNEIIKAQLRGGKVQGKLLTAQGKKELQAQLNNNENILKLRFGVEPEIKVTPAAVKGWAQGIKDQISALEEELNAPTTGQARYYEIQKKIDALNELLNPKKATKNNKQLAELFPDDSIKDLERKSQLITDALQTVQNGIVKLRKIDKYGNDKDKKGNALLTGESVSIEEAKSRLVKINEALAAKRKEIEVRSFEEEITETKRQIEVRDKLLRSGYTKDTVDNMFPAVKDKTFLQYLNDTSSALEKLEGKEPADKLIKLQNVLTDYTGSETFLENVNKQIESLKSQFIGNELIEKLEKFKKANLEGTTGDDKNAKNIAITKAQKEELDRQKNLYQEFLNEEASFQKKKTDIQKSYDLIRKQIAESSMSEEDKKSYTNTANKNEAKAISSASFEAFKKTDLWVKAFGDLDKIGPKTLGKLKKGLQEYLNSNKGNLTVTELKETQDQIKRLDDLMTSNNPYKAIGVAVDLYKKKRQELNDVEKKSGKDSDKYKEKLEETNQAFVNIVEITGAAAKATIEVVGTIGDAFGGLSDELKQTLAEVQQLIDGIVNTVAGYFSGNYGQMISGIVQIVSAAVKLLGDDKYREKQIKDWQRSVENLKTAYSELQYTIEKTAGEASLAATRGLIENLEEQKRLLIQMRDEEAKKKKVDADKITSLNSQISSVGQQIESVMDTFKKSVTTTDFKELSDNIANALIDAFGKGEDAAKAFDKVVDDVMRNAVANALKVKILEPAVKQMVDQIYSSFGYGGGNANANDAQIAKYQNDISELEKKIKVAESSNYYSPENTKYLLGLKDQKQKLVDLIGALKAQMAATPVGGSFDGLTAEEREKIKALGQNAMDQYMAALKQYEDLFGSSAENAQGLKGDIKGITEKTAGALEGQFNAVRINIVAVLKIMQGNQIVSNAQTTLLSQIEINTRRLHNMDKTLAEMNSKMKNNLAGIP